MPLAEVTAEQIDAVASAFGIECDAERRAILTHRDAVDVRACAGSGKTTLLVAKLALVMGGMADRFSGIAVLSHTNVAHEEVRRRFAVWPKLLDLEHRPHFIGTIQSFLNMIAGTPGVLRLFNMRPSIIDDETFGRRVERLIHAPQFTAARNWLNNRQNGGDLLRSLQWSVADNELVLASTAGNLPQPNTPTTKALRRLKMMLSLDGVFRFGDMNAIGTWYVEQCPLAVQATVRRFPALFIDEAQDTANEHDALIDKVFGNRSVVQRFGDDRQAIFSGRWEADAEATFPRPGYLTMTKSMRFGPSIAQLVQNVCGGTPEPLTGRDGYSNHAHTVFLFTPDTIHGVLPAFAKHVAGEIGCNRPASKVMAVGQRRDASSDPAKLPMKIGDYWHTELPSRRPLSTSFANLDEYLRAAESDVLNHSIRNARKRILQAACRILELQGIVVADRPPTPSTLLATLAETDHPHAPRLLVWIGQWMKACFAQEAWTLTAAKDAVLEGLTPIHAGPWSNDAITFTSEAAFDPPQGQTAQSGGAYVCEIGNDVVKVGLGTIHSVKGETIDAVLMVTNYFNKKHDLQQLAETGVLSGKRPTNAQLRQKILQANLRLAYVAMTRPSKLLCLAMRQDHVTATCRSEMETLGWKFQNVEPPATPTGLIANTAVPIG